MVVKEKTTTRPLKATASKEAHFGVPKKRTTLQREKHQPVSGTKKSIIIKPTKAREPKNGFVVITNNVQKKKPSQKISRTVSTSVLPMPAIRSPFRFPMVLSTNALVLTARVFGISFIAIGAILSFINLPISDSMHDSMQGLREMAATGDSLTQTTTTTQNTTSSGSGSLDTTSSGSGSLDTSPDPRISVQGTVLTGQVPVNISVALASGVKVIVQNKSTNQLITLGYATRIDETSWVYLWSTTQFPNAEYRFKVLITNQYESYDYSDSTTYEVKNATTLNTTQTQTTAPTPPVTEATTTTTSGTTASTTSSVSNTNTTVSLSIEDTDTNGNDTSFKVSVQSASRVTIHARNSSTNVLYYVGQALLMQNAGEWQLSWDSKKVPDGTYYFYAQAIVNSVTYKSADKKLTISHITDSSVPTASSSPILSATSTGQTSISISTDTLKPTISLSLSNENPQSGFSEIKISTSPVLLVELYAIPKNSLIEQFLGLALKRSETNWIYSWDTTQVPNGEYLVYARVKTQYGFTEGSRMSVRILNQIPSMYTESQENQIDKLVTTSDELNTISDDSDPESSGVYIEPVTTFVERLETDDEVRSKLSEQLSEFRRKLDTLLNEYAQAKRADDAESLKAIEVKFESLKNDLINTLPSSIEKKEIIDQVSTYISQVVYALQELTLQHEAILKERVGDVVQRDSDKDGISDYDEVHLYKTNPFSADTDGDGHTDGSEIGLGYDPHDSTAEALITYTSPKESGIVRDDLLSIDEIVTLTPDTEGEIPKAVLSGRGLPNSFVTLYIFSTPVVVTVKTDSDGNWSYIFDKELENGDHEMYVGIIDNRGDVIAKSNPFAFVKTAEAFTKIDPRTAAAQAEQVKPSFTNNKTLLVVGSMIVVFLGFVLIFVGLYAQRSRKSDDAVMSIA